ncbi:MAG: heat-inducible transcription repressor HrcA [Oscillospiraceae bacterium]|nr:heat-inducible transcription repressor HrcA [Oscillospiraceae bacterium]MBR0450555.1 heat-inducible transcription repressor HrcA [Oscillospiraceae bacterium]
MDISHRKQMILAEIVALHTDSGDPIGSRLLQEFLRDFSVSTATLRNEMAQLTTLGLLEQPHTSAGRIPTEEGYRYYLNNLMQAKPLDRSETKTIQSEVSKMDTDPDKAAEYAADSLASLSGLGAITSTPITTETQISYYDLVKVGRYNIAVLGVTNIGALKTRVCRADSELSDEDLEFIRNLLNSTLRFVSATDVTEDRQQEIIKQCGDKKEKYAEVIIAALKLLQAAGDVRVFRAGQRTLLRFPEIAEHVDEVVKLFEDTDGLAKLLSSEGNVECYVGRELGPGFDNLSMVVGRYRVAGGGHGGLAIVGPVRMNYENIVPRLSAYCKAMSEALAQR